MAEKIKAAVIGAGSWAAASHIPALAARDDVVLDGVSRLGADELEKVRSHFGFAFASQDHRELLARKPDVVVVASPHYLHYQHAMDALEAGAHVLCEKPMTLLPEEAWELVGKASSVDRHLVMGLPYQYLPHLDQLRELFVSHNAVGPIESIMCSLVTPTREVFAGSGLQKWHSAFFHPQMSTWQDPDKGGGFGYGQLSHAIPLMLWLTGLSPSAAYGLNLMHEGIDLCNAGTVLFDGGAVATIHGASTLPEGNRVLMRFIITGTDGVAILHFDQDHCEIRRRDGRAVEMKIGSGSWIINSATPSNALVDLALGKGENRSPGELGAMATDIIAAMLRQDKAQLVQLRKK